MARIWVVDDREFPSPSEDMTPEEAKAHFSVFFPEVSNAQVLGPTKRGDDEIYELRRTAGTKGACKQGCPHGLFESADRTYRCVGCHLYPDQCNCAPGDKERLLRMLGLADA